MVPASRSKAIARWTGVPGFIERGKLAGAWVPAC
jgi:hypothetical protein